MIAWVLCILCIIFGVAALVLALVNARLRRELNALTLELEEATRRLAEIEDARSPGGLFQKAVEVLVGMGVPGLILLAVMVTSGFAGAAAITTALAALGGPFGMLGGITLLIGMGLAAKALAEYGYPKLAQAVVRGLIEKGESRDSIRKTLHSIPKWIISSRIRNKVLESLGN
ncbi:MAG: hypothetical protein WBQ94_14470 [Terracidiphilus sp.]